MVKHKNRFWVYLYIDKISYELYDSLKYRILSVDPVWSEYDMSWTYREG